MHDTKDECPSNQVFPNELKLANILPVFNPGNDMLCNKYQPFVIVQVKNGFQITVYPRLLSFFGSQKSWYKIRFQVTSLLLCGTYAYDG